MDRGKGRFKRQADASSTKGIPAFTPQTRAERYAMGEKCSRSSHAEWKPSAKRPDPVQLIEEGDKGRIPQLVPLRQGRYVGVCIYVLPGTALIMAADLATTPTTGVYVRACGDAHLVNFRGFATPERQINFDIYDLDETLPAPSPRKHSGQQRLCPAHGPGERLATNFVLACWRMASTRILPRTRHSLVHALTARSGESAWPDCAVEGVREG